MSYVLEVLSRTFQHLTVFPATIKASEVGRWTEWTKAGLVVITDPETNLTIIDYDWGRYGSYADMKGKIILEPLDEEAYVVPEDRVLTMHYSSSDPILVRQSWFEVYRESRDNYVHSRALKLSDEDKGSLFRSKYETRGMWSYGNDDNKQRYYLNGSEVTSGTGGHLLTRPDDIAPERYEVKYIYRDNVTADDTVTNLKWVSDSLNYSSLLVARYGKIGRNVGGYKAWYIGKVNDLGDLGHFYLNGKEVEGGDIEAWAQNLIDQAKRKQAYLIGDDANVSVHRIRRDSLRSPTLMGVAAEVALVAGDIERIALALTTNRPKYDALYKAQNLIDEAARVLREASE